MYIWFTVLSSYIKESVILGQQSDFCNKIIMVHALRTSSLNLLHTMLQPVLSLQAVINLSAGISILLTFAELSHAVIYLCIHQFFLTLCSSVQCCSLLVAVNIFAY
jgi:hypothetical protein